MDREVSLQGDVRRETLAIKKQMKEGFHGVDLKLDAIFEMLDVRQRIEKYDKWFQQLAKNAGVELKS